MQDDPAISVIIPALREEARIAETLRQFSRLPRCCSTELIVVDGDASGGTIRALETSGVEEELANRTRVQTLCCPPGRGLQMNTGAARAAGDILLFLHADSRLPADALHRICGTMREEDTEVGAFDLAYEEDGPWLRLLEFCANRRSRWTGIPYGDQAIFLKRELFQAVGGYSEIPLMEDLDLMRRLRLREARLRILEERVKVSGRRYRRDGAFYGPLRNNALAILFFLGVSPVRLARYYRYGNTSSEKRN